MLIDLALTAALVPLFIDVLGLGLPGAPLGQALSQLVMIAVVWRALHAQRERWHLGVDPPRASIWSRTRFAEILDIGLPPQLARIAMFAAYTYLLQRVASDGRSAVIGFGLALTIYFFAITVSGSVGRATGIALGQRIGAKDEDGARKALRVGLVMSFAISCALVALITVLAPHLVSIFVSNEQIIADGTFAVRILALAIPLLGISQVFLFAFTAVKASKRAGMAGIIADAIGIVFVLAWPGERQLEAAAWTIFVSNAIRTVMFSVLGRIIIGRAIRTALQPK
jgi:Na+-driven multidrug efflux pump